MELSISTCSTVKCLTVRYRPFNNKFLSLFNLHIQYNSIHFVLRQLSASYDSRYILNECHNSVSKLANAKRLRFLCTLRWRHLQGYFEKSRVCTLSTLFSSYSTVEQIPDVRILPISYVSNISQKFHESLFSNRTI